ncbi:hypothetical protein IJL65_02725 [bacterium]|nr:hypothetical protein [bacterium]
MNIPSEEISFPFEVVIANGEELCDCGISSYCTCGEPLTFLEKVRREL